MNILVEEHILYKKRGLGMFVKTGAVQQIKEKRQHLFYSQYIETMINEAKKLNMTKQEIMSLIERGYQDE